MPEFRTLEQTPVAEITRAFNEAFSDYFIPFSFSEEGMAAKIKAENILLHYSVGAFDGDKLVGFILHGYEEREGERTVYNAGTGVIPSYRKNGIAYKMYNFIIPLLRSQGIHHHLLEVIDTNTRAFDIYQQLGFKIARTLAAYKGAFRSDSSSMLDVRPIGKNEWRAAEHFMDVLPAWQNNSHCIDRLYTDHELVGVFDDNLLAGYAVYIPSTGRIKQFAVDSTKRRKGCGKALFNYMAANSSSDQLTITNLDVNHQPSVDFLNAVGFQKMLGLYEMKMVVN